MKKEIIKPLVECLCSLSEKQALILQLLSTKIDLNDEERRKLLDSAKESETSAKTIRQSLVTYL